jgi:hypothetical protein
MGRGCVVSNTNVPFDVLYAVALDQGIFEPVMSIPGNGIQVAVSAHDYDILELQYLSSEYNSGVMSSEYRELPRYVDDEHIVSYELRKAVIGDNMFVCILDRHGSCL